MAEGKAGDVVLKVVEPPSSAPSAPAATLIPKGATSSDEHTSALAVGAIIPDDFFPATIDVAALVASGARPALIGALASDRVILRLNDTHCAILDEHYNELVGVKYADVREWTYADGVFVLSVGGRPDFAHGTLRLRFATARPEDIGSVLSRRKQEWERAMKEKKAAIEAKRSAMGGATPWEREARALEQQEEARRQMETERRRNMTAEERAAEERLRRKAEWADLVSCVTCPCWCLSYTCIFVLWAFHKRDR